MDIDEFRAFAIAELSRLKPDTAHALAGLDLETDLITSGIVDSFAFLELCLAIERKTGAIVDLGELEPEQFSTLRGLYGIVGATSG